MSTRTRILLPLAALALIGSGAILHRALASGAPIQTPLVYTGTLTDASGKPYAIPQDVLVRFYDKPDATVSKCTSPTVVAEANTGRFSVILPPDCAQAVHDVPDLWSEVTAGKTTLPRVHVGAVPYAVEADAAKTAVIATGVQCVGCVKVDALAFDKDVDLKGKALVAGKIALGSGPNEDLTAAKVQTLTGGGNADALHTHSGGGAGGGGVVIKFKGVTAVKMNGGQGIDKMNAQCANEFGATRMCTSETLEFLYPMPAAPMTSWILATGVPAFHSNSNLFMLHVAGIGMVSLNYGNCGEYKHPVNDQKYLGTVVQPTGAVETTTCDMQLPIACCGP